MKMISKLLEYNIDKIDSHKFGNLDLSNLISRLEENNLKIAAVIPFQRGNNFAKFILEELNVDLDEYIIYPEKLSGIVYYDGKEIVFGDYRYLVIFKETTSMNSEELYWYHAYKELNNLGLELELMEEKNRCL